MAAGFVLIVNGAAGTALDERVDAAASSLAESGPVRRAATTSLAEVDRVVAEAGDPLVVACGGDGTLHAVVQALARRGELGDRPVGLVPLGTGNDLARGLGLPLDPAAAGRRVAAGRPRPLDLLVGDDGMVVVNAVHAGLGAEAAERAADLKSTLGPLAYPVGALIAGVREQGWQLSVEVDGDVVAAEVAVLMIGVANGPTIGGGTPLAPGARPDDGLAEVVVTTAVGPAARVGFARDLQRGAHLERDDVVHRRGSTVRIWGDAVRFNADGELSEPVADRTFRMVPGGWWLVC